MIRRATLKFNQGNISVEIILNPNHPSPWGVWIEDGAEYSRHQTLQQAYDWALSEIEIEREYIKRHNQAIMDGIPQYPPIGGDLNEF